MQHEYRITPRIGETDALGHINHASVAVWLEASREWLYDVFNPEKDILNWKLVIVKLEINYLDQLYYSEDVLIKSYLSKIGNTSLIIHSEIFQGNRKCIDSTAVYVHFDKQLQKSVPIKENQKKHLTKYLEESFI